MRVAVVGAGLAGIAAARELVAGGHEVVVVEKGRGLGERPRAAPAPPAQAPRGPSLRAGALVPRIHDLTTDPGSTRPARG